LDKRKKKVAVVTGSSSGIGLETSLLLARRGFDTYATMRNFSKSRTIMDLAEKALLPLQVVELDVNSDVSSVKYVFEKIIQEKKRIDVLVNNAGYALVGAIEDLSINEIKAQFETNLFGVIKCIQSVLPIMRKQQSGTIVNVSSIAGRIGFPLTPAYVSSKFALEGLSESMRYELAQFGINIVLIEPGVVKTSFGNNLKIGQMVTNSGSAYTQIMQKRIAGFKPRFEKGIPPLEVAKIIVKAATSERPEPRYLVGDDATMQMQTKKNMSDSEFEKLMIKNILSG
jgi:NAD(P)-dependent dehydrogenase (short-subunit alcohol dehydrogenase family)